jgi:hypothetical protein
LAASEEDTHTIPVKLSGQALAVREEVANRMWTLFEAEAAMRANDAAL